MKSAGFRFNPDRAIFLCGEITESLVRSLTPEILRLRYGSNDPISLVIDSPGGVIRQATVLEGLLTSPDQDGRHGRVISIVTGHAASAAADLLVCSDYAIAYPSAVLHFHGARYETVDDLTVESSRSLADRLLVSNNRTAIREARRALNRIVLRYLAAKSEFASIRAAAPGETLSDLDCFAGYIRQRAESSALGRIIDRMQETREQLNEMLHYVVKRLDEQPKDFRYNDIWIYRTILNFTEAQTPSAADNLTEELRERIDQGFTLLSDYLQGEYRNDRMPIVRRYGSFFLTSEQAEEFKLKNFQNDEERDSWLSGRTANEIEELWYFTILLWRNLQRDENALSPTDGFWVGAVDEVLGSELTCLREIVEATSEKEFSNSASALPPKDTTATSAPISPSG